MWLPAGSHQKLVLFNLCWGHHSLIISSAKWAQGPVSLETAKLRITVECCLSKALSPGLDTRAASVSKVTRRLGASRQEWPSIPSEVKQTTVFHCLR